MIELGMVGRMARRGALVAPLVVAALALAGGLRSGDAVEWGLSAAAGLAMTLGNLWLAGRIIGGVAENQPTLLLAAALISFALGLALLTGMAFALTALEMVYFPVTGLTLVGSHLALVLWEAAGVYSIQPDAQDRIPSQDAANARS